MVQAVSSREVHRQAFDTRGNDYILSHFLGDPFVSGEGPQGFLVELLTPHGVIEPHFHRVNQFQVVIAGGGRLGKHPIGPVVVHYTDGFTPYGPIVAEGEGLTFYTLRGEPDVNAYYMPGSRDKMERRAGRSWSHHVAPHEGDAAGSAGAPLTGLLEGHADGLAAFSLRLAPGGAATGPDPRSSGGQYYVVVDGSLILDGRELPPRSLIFVSPDEAAPEVGAGPAGLDAVIVQLPRAA